MEGVTYRQLPPKGLWRQNPDQPRGLTIHARLGLSIIGFATCHEGFKLAPTIPGFEPNVFDIDYVQTEPGYEGNGIGTGLFDTALNIAKVSGFKYARMTIGHAATAHILEKLHQQGVASTPIFYRVDRNPAHPEQRLPTTELMESKQALGSTAILNYMNKQQHTDVIECVVPLVP